MSVWFTGDTHFGHKKIIDYCERPFNSVENMNWSLTNHWNARVAPDDVVYHVGDFAFGNKYAESMLNELNGKIHLIRGNHDQSLSLRLRDRFASVKDISVIKVPDETHPEGEQGLVLCHYALRVWPHKHHGYWHLYGHCLDLQTEVLTNNGWKFRNEINDYDKVLTLNLNTKQLEYNTIDEFVDYTDYVGEVYNLKSRGTDLRMTPYHTLIEFKKWNGQFRKFYAKELPNTKRRTFIKSGNINNLGLDLLDNDIRLLVWIAADGNVCNSNLIRIHLWKRRKITQLRELLNKINDLQYKELSQNDNSISFNFTFPDRLIDYGPKPLSPLFAFCNQHQAKILIDEYSKTDGYKNGATTIIYTSKKEESDTIQIACITNGFQCNIAQRKQHGFSKKISYELCVTNGRNRMISDVPNHTIIETVNQEHFWCLKVKNQTLMVRRNGKPIIVGNSHGNLPDDPKSMSMDVGVDCHGFVPIGLEDVKLQMFKTKKQ